MLRFKSGCDNERKQIRGRPRRQRVVKNELSRCIPWSYWFHNLLGLNLQRQRLIPTRNTKKLAAIVRVLLGTYVSSRPFVLCCLTLSCLLYQARVHDRRSLLKLSNEYGKTGSAIKIGRSCENTPTVHRSSKTWGPLHIYLLAGISKKTKVSS